MPDYLERFKELSARSHNIVVTSTDGYRFANTEQYRAWLASALNLLELTFGKNSTFFSRLKSEADKGSDGAFSLETSRGLFAAAKEEFELGFTQSIRKEISEEFVVDACLRAEEILREGYLEPAAVLVAAALEDCFRRKAEENEIDTEGKTLSDYINALKSKGELSGATAKIVSNYPKFRNAALHADWKKISEADVLGISAFLKSYTIQK